MYAYLFAHGIESVCLSGIKQHNEGVVLENKNFPASCLALSNLNSNWNKNKIFKKKFAQPVFLSVSLLEREIEK